MSEPIEFERGPRMMAAPAGDMFRLLHAIRGAVAELHTATQEGGATRADVEALGEAVEELSGIIALGKVVLAEAERARDEAADSMEAQTRDDDELFELFQAFVAARGEGGVFTIRELEDYFADNGVLFDEDEGGIGVYFEGWQESVMEQALEEGRSVRWVRVPGSRGQPARHALAPVKTGVRRRPAAPSPPVKKPPVTPGSKAGELAGGQAGSVADTEPDPAVEAVAAGREVPTEGVAEGAPSAVEGEEDRTGEAPGNEGLAPHLQVVLNVVRAGDIRPSRLYKVVSTLLNVDEQVAAQLVRGLRSTGIIHRFSRQGSMFYSVREHVVTGPSSGGGDTGAATSGETSGATAEMTPGDKALAVAIMEVFTAIVTSETTLLEPRQILTSLLELPSAPPATIESIKNVCRRLTAQNILRIQRARQGRGRRMHAQQSEVLKVGFASRAVIKTNQRNVGLVRRLIASGESLNPDMLQS